MTRAASNADAGGLSAAVDEAIAVAQKRLSQLGRGRTAVDCAERNGIRLVLGALERAKRAHPTPEAVRPPTWAGEKHRERARELVPQLHAYVTRDCFLHDKAERDAECFHMEEALIDTIAAALAAVERETLELVVTEWIAATTHDIGCPYVEIAQRSPCRCDSHAKLAALHSDSHRERRRRAAVSTLPAPGCW